MVIGCDVDEFGSTLTFLTTYYRQRQLIWFEIFTLIDFVNVDHIGDVVKILAINEHAITQAGHTHIHSHTHTHKQTHKHTHKQTHTHTHTLHTHTSTHAYKHSHTHTYTRTNS